MAESYFRNKDMRRRRKTAGERQARMKVHQRRLVALGVPEDTVMTMNVTELRDALKRPVKTAAKYATAN
ncbi:MAG: hypothetical protein RRC34_03970 [Lentisphaeria bacterium]|nr:hypothetical protein [Lentisphaeria bacterium]